MSRSILVAAVAALSVSFGSQAYAATMTGEQLSGITTDGHTTIFKYDLSSAGKSVLHGFTIRDGGDLVGTGGGLYSGLDINGVVISSESCDTAACVSSIQSTGVAIDFDNVGFTMGSIVTSDPLETLAGTVGGAINHSYASLNNVASGFVSLGLNGVISFSLMENLDLLADTYYLYIAETGKFGAELAIADITLENPLPGALPLMASALIGWRLISRRRKSAGK